MKDSEYLIVRNMFKLSQATLFLRRVTHDNEIIAFQDRADVIIKIEDWARALQEKLKLVSEEDE